MKVMVDALQNIGDKIVAVILATSALANGLFAVVQTTIAPSPSQNIASVNDTVIPPKQESTSTTISPETAGSLPIVILSPHKASTTTKTKATSTAQISAITAPKIAVPNIAASAITAQWLSDNTKLSFKQKRDGTYEAVFTTKTGGKDLVWGVEDAFIGGTTGIPKFAFSFSCNPPLEVPPPDSPDQTMFFKVRTTYDCTIGFAATSGNSQEMRSKNMHIETGPGQLAVAPPLAMNTLLADDSNQGGFVFTNNDTKAITITKLVLDLSYTGLSMLNGPIVMRVVDPSNETPFLDYHMENMAANPVGSYTHTASGVEAQINFTLGPSSQKLLPIQLLGVHRMSVFGVDPSATITLRALTTDSNDVPIVLSIPQIRWSCVVPLGAYDPNATSGPFAMGVACR